MVEEFRYSKAHMLKVEALRGVIRIFCLIILPESN